MPVLPWLDSDGKVSEESTPACVRRPKADDRLVTGKGELRGIMYYQDRSSTPLDGRRVVGLKKGVEIHTAIVEQPVEAFQLCRMREGLRKRSRWSIQKGARHRRDPNAEPPIGQPRGAGRCDEARSRAHGTR